MGFWKKLFGRKKKKQQEAFEEINWNDMTIDRDGIEISDREQRRRYISECLRQMEEASKELEILTREYNMVTSDLTDIEEIELLPKDIKEDMVESAKRVQYLGQEKAHMEVKASRLSEFQYRRMERLEEEMPEGYQKVKETEEFQKIVKADLRKLDGEKHAYQFRKGEAAEAIENTRGLTIICIGIMMACMVVLLVLQLALTLDVGLGYFLVILAGVLMVTILYMKHLDARKEHQKAEFGIKKIISLQNTVKIRYVNNTRLLEYLYEKYGVDSSKKLWDIWQVYQEEKAQQEKFEKTDSDLAFFSKDFVNKLRQYNIKNPAIWLHQIPALLDEKEMVEVRHELIMRRQKLRKQMDYNKNLAETAQEEVKDLAQNYPEYAKEILEQVSEYENH